MPPSRSKEHEMEHQIEHKIVIENVSGDLILPGGYLDQALNCYNINSAAIINIPLLLMNQLLGAAGRVASCCWSSADGQGPPNRCSVLCGKDSLFAVRGPSKISLSKISGRPKSAQ